MKKVLCGLVVAVMMTGSVYAGLDKDDCSYLKEQASLIVSDAKYYRNELDAMEGSKKSNLAILRKQLELENIKKAHYYAVTWSALCD
jgi:hypothetical protein